MRRRLKWLLSKFHWIPDATYHRWAYWLLTGRRLNLDRPVTFNEKLNWIKLHGSTHLYAPLVDKLAVRNFVARVVGVQYLVPMINSYETPLLTRFMVVDRCVVKCTHGSHCSIAVNSRAHVDTCAMANQLRRWMITNWYWHAREPPYRAIPPRIIVEELLGDGITPPVDYKVMCFGGEPEVVQVHRRRGTETTIDFYTAYGARLDWRKTGYGNSPSPYIERSKLQDMIPVARALARETGAPYVRVDLYHEGGRVYFGELTFFDSAGYRDFEPAKVNAELGAMIDLTTIRRQGS